MLIFEEGFEGCSLGFTHSARWAAVGTAKLDEAVAAPSLLLRGTGGERACLLPGRLREGANSLVFLVLARDAGPPEQEEVAVVTLARAEVILRSNSRLR